MYILNHFNMNLTLWFKSMNYFIICVHWMQTTKVHYLLSASNNMKTKHLTSCELLLHIEGFSHYNIYICNITTIWNDCNYAKRKQWESNMLLEVLIGHFLDSFFTKTNTRTKRKGQHYIYNVYMYTCILCLLNRFCL